MPVMAMLLTAILTALPIGLALGLASMFMPQWFTGFILVPLFGLAVLAVPVYAVVGAAREAWAALRPPPLTRRPDPPAPVRRRNRLGEPG